MIVTVIGLAIVLLAAFYVAWPLLQAAPVASPVADDVAAGTAEHDKDQALRAIREADFDHRTGKLSDEDYGVLRAELEGRALSAMAAIERANALHAAPPAPGAAPGATSPATSQAPRGAEPGGFCPACGVRFARDARYCSGCGKKLPAAPPRGRRRA